MKIIFQRIFLASFVLLFCQKPSAQVLVSGPTCAVRGTLYQYVINGDWDSSSSVQVCINGGSIADSVNGNACSPSLHSLTKVMVVWNNSITDNGSVNVTSSHGNWSLTVHFTKELLAGSIDSASKVQLITLNTIPASIKCGNDSGGSCSPVYRHQWQWSLNAVSWTDIPSATGQDLIIDSALTQSKFYRRKVTELSSGSVAYSGLASVLVIVPPDSTSQTTSLMSNDFIEQYTKQKKEIYAEVSRHSLTAALPQKDLMRKTFFKTTLATIEK